MISILLRVLGVLVAVEAAFLASRGFDSFKEVSQLDNSITRTVSELAGHRTSQEVADQNIAGYHQRQSAARKEGIVWFAVAGALLVVGISTALLPSFFRSPRKKKDLAAVSAPTQNGEPPGGRDGGQVPPPGGAEPAPSPHRQAPGL